MRIEAGRTILGKRTFSIPAGRTTTVHVRLGKANRRLLARRRAIRARVTVLSRGTDGILRRAAIRTTVKAR